MSGIPSFWKEMAITQVCSSSVSFLASSSLAAFVMYRPKQARAASVADSHSNCRTCLGLSTPYRRLIFGISISDMIQSLALIIGPWVTEKGVPLAFWGIGNAFTCRLDGVLLALGIGLVPNYTFALSIYYLCKLKFKMSDAVFYQMIEKKMHIVIILLNVLLCVIFLALGVFNPGGTGTVCYAAAIPTGCRSSNVDCFEPLDRIVSFYGILNSFVFPLTGLLGCITCTSMVWWHVVWREKMYGVANQRPADGSRISIVRRHRNSPLSIDESSSRIPESLDISSSPEDNSSSLSIQDDSVKSDCNISHIKDECKLEILTRIIDEPAANDRSKMPPQIKMPPQSFISLDDEEGEAHERIATNRTSTNRMSTNSISSHAADAFSRLYRRELVTQLFSYFAVFCVTFVPFIVTNIMLISGKNLPVALLRILHLFYPLGGFSNVLIYLRPKVTGLRRLYPGCSRLRAFFLVLKAGGEIPEDIHVTTSRCKFCCAPLDKNHDDEDAPPCRQSIVSSNPIGEVLPLSEKFNSHSAIHGLSASMSRNDHLFRSSAEWMHVEGDESRLIFRDEDDIENNKVLDPEDTFDVSSKQKEEVSVFTDKSVE